MPPVIEDLPFPERRVDDRADDIPVTLDLLGGDDDDILGKADPDQGQVDLHRLASLRADHRHDDEKIRIAVRPGRSPGMGAEQDDLLRGEPLDNPADRLPNGLLRIDLGHDVAS